MHVIIIIIVALVIIGLIYELVEEALLFLRDTFGKIVDFIIKHPYVSSVALVAIIMIFASIPLALLLLIASGCLWYIDKLQREANENKLTEYLTCNCGNLGFVGHIPLERIASDFVDAKLWSGTYHDIVRRFLSYKDESIKCNQTAEWIQPALIYLRKYGMADIAQLDSIVRIETTHIQPDIKFVQTAMQNICANGKEYSWVSLKNGAAEVAKGLGFDGTQIDEIYLNAYICNQCSNSEFLVREEITLDELFSEDFGEGLTVDAPFNDELNNLHEEVSLNVKDDKESNDEPSPNKQDPDEKDLSYSAFTEDEDFLLSGFGVNAEE